MRWWEPDLSGWVIAVLAKAGVVWNLKMPDRQKIESRLRRNRPPVKSTDEHRKEGWTNVRTQ
jgi:stearoyl-CoA desaturase (delta-9 desaturase)